DGPEVGSAAGDRSFCPEQLSGSLCLAELRHCDQDPRRSTSTTATSVGHAKENQPHREGHLQKVRAVGAVQGRPEERRRGGPEGHQGHVQHQSENFAGQRRLSITNNPNASLSKYIPYCKNHQIRFNFHYKN
ncbi:hypothetical protein pipiens_000405, partial [Culex pipiens pipiens]